MKNKKKESPKVYKFIHKSGRILIKKSLARNEDRILRDFGFKRMNPVQAFLTVK